MSQVTDPTTSPTPQQQQQQQHHHHHHHDQGHDSAPRPLQAQEREQQQQAQQHQLQQEGESAPQHVMRAHHQSPVSQNASSSPAHDLHGIGSFPIEPALPPAQQQQRQQHQQQRRRRLRAPVMDASPSQAETAHGSEAAITPTSSPPACSPHTHGPGSCPRRQPQTALTTHTSQHPFQHPHPHRHPQQPTSMSSSQPQSSSSSEAPSEAASDVPSVSDTTSLAEASQPSNSPLVNTSNTIAAAASDINSPAHRLPHRTGLLGQQTHASATTATTTTTTTAVTGGSVGRQSPGSQHQQHRQQQAQARGMGGTPSDVSRTTPSPPHRHQGSGSAHTATPTAISADKRARSLVNLAHPGQGPAAHATGAFSGHQHMVPPGTSPSDTRPARWPDNSNLHLLIPQTSSSSVPDNEDAQESRSRAASHPHIRQHQQQEQQQQQQHSQTAAMPSQRLTSSQGSQSLQQRFLLQQQQQQQQQQQRIRQPLAGASLPLTHPPPNTPTAASYPGLVAGVYLGELKWRDESNAVRKTRFRLYINSITQGMLCGYAADSLLALYAVTGFVVSTRPATYDVLFFRFGTSRTTEMTLSAVGDNVLQGTTTFSAHGQQHVRIYREMECRPLGHGQPRPPSLPQMVQQLLHLQAEDLAMLVEKHGYRELAMIVRDKRLSFEQLLCCPPNLLTPRLGIPSIYTSDCTSVVRCLLRMWAHANEDAPPSNLARFNVPHWDHAFNACYGVSAFLEQPLASIDSFLDLDPASQRDLLSASCSRSNAFYSDGAISSLRLLTTIDWTRSDNRCVREVRRATSGNPSQLKLIHLAAMPEEKLKNLGLNLAVEALMDFGGEYVSYLRLGTANLRHSAACHLLAKGCQYDCIYDVYTALAWCPTLARDAPNMRDMLNLAGQELLKRLLRAHMEAAADRAQACSSIMGLGTPSFLTDAASSIYYDDDDDDGEGEGHGGDPCSGRRGSARDASAAGDDEAACMDDDANNVRVERHQRQDGVADDRKGHDASMAVLNEYGRQHGTGGASGKAHTKAPALHRQRSRRRGGGGDGGNDRDGPPTSWSSPSSLRSASANALDLLMPPTLRRPFAKYIKRFAMGLAFITLVLWGLTIAQMASLTSRRRLAQGSVTSIYSTPTLSLGTCICLFFLVTAFRHWERFVWQRGILLFLWDTFRFIVVLLAFINGVYVSYHTAENLNQDHYPMDVVHIALYNLRTFVLFGLALVNHLALNSSTRKESLRLMRHLTPRALQPLNSSTSVGIHSPHHHQQHQHHHHGDSSSGSHARGDQGNGSRPNSSLQNSHGHHHHHGRHGPRSGSGDAIVAVEEGRGVSARREVSEGSGQSGRGWIPPWAGAHLSSWLLLFMLGSEMEYTYFIVAESDLKGREEWVYLGCYWLIDLFLLYVFLRGALAWDDWGVTAWWRSSVSGTWLDRSHRGSRHTAATPATAAIGRQPHKQRTLAAKGARSQAGRRTLEAVRQPLLQPVRPTHHHNQQQQQQQRGSDVPTGGSGGVKGYGAVAVRGGHDDGLATWSELQQQYGTSPAPQQQQQQQQQQQRASKNKQAKKTKKKTTTQSRQQQ